MFAQFNFNHCQICLFDHVSVVYCSFIVADAMFNSVYCLSLFFDLIFIFSWNIYCDIIFWKRNRCFVFLSSLPPHHRKVFPNHRTCHATSHGLVSSKASTRYGTGCNHHPFFSPSPFAWHNWGPCWLNRLMHTIIPKHWGEKRKTPIQIRFSLVRS